MDKLTQELMESVDKNLPQMVGDQLKARLMQADKDKEIAAKVPALESMLAECKKKLEGIDKRESAVTQRESVVDLRERNAEVKEKLIELREKHATERVSEMRCVVQDVFANSKLKYQETYGHTSPSGGYISGSRTVESAEGK